MGGLSIGRFVRHQFWRLLAERISQVFLVDESLPK